MIKNLVWLVGIVFIIIGFLGFIPGNKIVGPGSLFETDAMHNIVHLLSGVIAIAAVLSGEAMARNYLRIFGVVYVLVAILGFMGSSDSILGILVTNNADNWLHAVLAVVFLAVGFIGGKGMKASGSMPTKSNMMGGGMASGSGQ
ncbi:MAG TPA: DUF4383 domain-containing protein [Candidatus Paceibacterota bacterium]